MKENERNWKEFAKTLCDVENVYQYGISGTILNKKERENDRISIYEKKSITVPPGRIFFRWFPFPHLVGVPLNGLRTVSMRVFREKLFKLSKERAKEFATPYHVFLSMKIYPWYNMRTMMMVFENQPSWLIRYFEKNAVFSDDVRSGFVSKITNRDKKDDFFLAVEACGDSREFFTRLVQRQMRCGRIVEAWRRWGILGKIKVTADMAVETSLGEDSPYYHLVQEEILCYHDELACQVRFHR